MGYLALVILMRMLRLWVELDLLFLIAEQFMIKVSLYFQTVLFFFGGG